MSGTASGTVVLHVAPESAVGGPLALVRDGDIIRLDVGNSASGLVGVGRSTGRAAPESGDIHAGLAGSGRRLSRTLSCARSAS